MPPRRSALPALTAPVPIQARTPSRWLSLLQVPYSAVNGLLVALFDAVPQVGAIIAAVVATLIALSGGWQPAIITLVVVVVAYLLRQRRRDRERSSTWVRAREAARDLAGASARGARPAAT